MFADSACKFGKRDICPTILPDLSFLILSYIGIVSILYVHIFENIELGFLPKFMIYNVKTLQLYCFGQHDVYIASNIKKQQLVVKENS